VTEESPPTPSRWTRSWPWVKRLLLVAASLIAARIIVNLVGAIDWAAVGESLGRLSVAQFAVLGLVLFVRQLLNAVPLARFVPGLSLGRSLQNDLSANLIGTIAPPPGDIVLRVSMFRSWGVDPIVGMAGVTLNTLAFYVIRFVAPAVGLVVLSVQGFDTGQVVAALGALAIAAAIVVALVLIARGDRFAHFVGQRAGRVVGRFRDSVDPEVWAQAVVDFRALMSRTIKTGLPPSLVALQAMVLTDAFLLFLALRFVGIGSGSLSAVDIFGAFLLAYPLTLLPLFGFGILDAALLATWVEIGGLSIEPEVVAALGVWRAYTLLGPLLFGGPVMLLWRRSTTHEDRAIEGLGDDIQAREAPAS
jgi:putative heme transporter